MSKSSPKTQPSPALKARLVVVETVTHVPPQGEPTSVGVGFAQTLETDEAPYRRPSGTFKVGPDWRPLELGWLGEEGAKVSQVVIANIEGTDLQKVPTPEERAATSALVVQIGTETGAGVFPFSVIRPGQSTRFEPYLVELVRVRCLGGTARCNLFVVPG